MKCRSCGIESPATLCDTCFLDEVITAVEMGEQDPSKILRGMAAQYGRLRNLKALSSYRSIFGPEKLRRVITTEEGERCRLVPSYDGWVAVCQGPKSEAVVIEGPEGKRVRLPGQSAEGGRVITYYRGKTPVKEVHLPTSLVFPKSHVKRTRRVPTGPPSPHYRSPQAYDRPPSSLDQER